MCVCFHLALFPSSLQIACDDSAGGIVTWKESVSPNHLVEEKQLWLGSSKRNKLLLIFSSL